MDSRASPYTWIPSAASGARLVQRLVVLGAGIGVGDDPSAGVYVGALPAQEDRANGDIQHAGVARADPAHVPAVDRTPDRFEFVDDLHGADLRRAGHGATGAKGGDQVSPSGVAPGIKPAFQQRDGVPDRRVFLDVARAHHADAAVRAHPPQVIPQQIDDHGQFGAVLGTREKLLAQRGVARRIAPIARACALDRPGAEVAAAALEEEFRRGADDGAVVKTEERRELRGGQHAKPAINVLGFRAHVHRPALGEIGLVDIARGNVLLDPADLGKVVGSGNGLGHDGAGNGSRLVERLDGTQKALHAVEPLVGEFRASSLHSSVAIVQVRAPWS